MPPAERSTPATPSALGRSPIVAHAIPSRIRRLTFQSAVTSEMSASLSALESASVESVGQTPNARHQVKNPGCRAGQLVRNAVARANGRRKVKRPQTLMYSSRAWPRRFMAVLRSTWNSAAASARASHMAAIVSQGSGRTAGGGSGEERGGEEGEGAEWGGGGAGAPRRPGGQRGNPRRPPRYFSSAGPP